MPNFEIDRFHHCALPAGFVARRRAFLSDSERVRRLAYRLYEQRPLRGARSPGEGKAHRLLQTPGKLSIKPAR